MNQFSITNFSRTKIKYSLIESLINSCKKELKIKELNMITFVLVGEKIMAKINLDYRKKKGPTDTISFAFEESDEFPGEELLGEIYLCPTYIKKNAKIFGTSFEKEFCEVIVHSILHLLKYTHETEDKLGIMQDLTRRIIDKIKI